MRYKILPESFGPNPVEFPPFHGFFVPHPAAAAGKDRAHPKQAEISSMPEKVWKILLINDDPGSRKIMSLVLDDSGYAVVTAENGERGLELCAAENPDIVITDMTMEGMNGIEVLRRVKHLDPEKEVIVLAAFGESDLAIRALKLHASDFISKPVNNDALMIALERAKERWNTRKELRDYSDLLEEKWMSTSEELARMFHFQEMLIENSMDGILACDRKKRIIVFNRALEVMLGYPKNQVVKRLCLRDLFVPGEYEKFEGALGSSECGERNRLHHFRTALRSQEGTVIPGLLSAAVLETAGDEVGIVGFFRNVCSIEAAARAFHV